MPEYKGLLDMLDGGGAGRSGQTFEGGPLSGILNALGIRPMGFMDRQAAVRPMPRPMMTPAPAMQPQMAPPSPSPLVPSPITTTTLPPMGQMSDEQLMQIIRQALQQAPSAIGYGPR